jgi:hypothetical protein
MASPAKNGITRNRSKAYANSLDTPIPPKLHEAHGKAHGHAGGLSVKPANWGVWGGFPPAVLHGRAGGLGGAMTPRQKAALRELIDAFQEHEVDVVADPDAVADPRTVAESRLEQETNEVTKGDLERTAGVTHEVRTKVFRGQYGDTSAAAKKLLAVLDGRIPIQIRRKKMTGFERSRLQTRIPDPSKHTADPYTAK